MRVLYRVECGADFPREGHSTNQCLNLKSTDYNKLLTFYVELSGLRRANLHELSLFRDNINSVRNLLTGLLTTRKFSPVS